MGSILYKDGTILTSLKFEESDNKKIQALTSMGYRVITIWESDDLEEAKKILEKI